MSSVKGSVYQRGPFWLDYRRGPDGAPISQSWYIWWYDEGTGRNERRSTRSNDVRVACGKLDEHYLASHRPTAADQVEYCVADAMTDYWTEHGQHLPSAPAIKAQFKTLQRFIDAEQAAKRAPSPLMPEHIDDMFLVRFRAWGVADPIIARKKDDKGNWVDGAHRPRSASTVEESVIRLKAALNHAFNQRRTRYVPPIKHKTRKEVTPRRSYRLSLSAIGELLDYSLRGAGSYSGRLLPMRRYLIAGICTLARPDAIFDMNVSRAREQWGHNSHTFDLNPVGRLQTKKVRPVLPVVSVLDAWLKDTQDWFVCNERTVIDPKTNEASIEQYRVMSIRKSWDGARAQLGIPDGWGPKLLRHSMASILANRRVDLTQLEMALGHRTLRATTSIYAEFDPDYLDSVRLTIEDVLADLTKMVPDAFAPNSRQTSEEGEE